MATKKRKPIAGSSQAALPRPRTARAAAPDPNERIEIGVHLRYRTSSPGLPSLEELCKSHPLERKHLSHKEFEEVHGADPEDVTKVKAFARRHSLKIVDVDLAHRLVRLSGTIADLSSAFKVELVHHDHPDRPDCTFRCHTGEVYIPEKLHDIVTGVFGLDNRPVAKRRAQIGNNAQKLRGFYPSQLAQLYNFPSDVTGEGQSIAIIELGGGYDPKCLQNYFENVVKVPAPTIESVSVGGASNEPNGPTKADDEEVYLDIEVAGSIAHGANIIVYFAEPTWGGFLQALKQAVHDQKHNNTIISISWNFPEEPGMYTDKIGETLYEAALKGITVCVASGDYGSRGIVPNGGAPEYAYVDYPASSPYALACGGTTLLKNKKGFYYDVVWNNGRGGATGGGVSQIFPCPIYQKKVNICPHSVNPGAGTGRGVPDVAGLADLTYTGYIIQVGNNPLSISGGTSAATPLWAALVALINQKLGGQVGFLNSFIYQIGKSKSAFYDVTEGNNNTSTQVGGYTAGTGWDACTGWGSPNGQKLLEALQGS